MKNPKLPASQFLVYADESDRIKIDVRLEDETVWLTQQAIADLFQTSLQNINQHIGNILDEEELKALNNLVEQYLLFAEGQAMRRKPMHMAEWIAKLDDFLKLNERSILTDAGRISHDLAVQLAGAEYEKFHVRQIVESDAALSDFDRTVKSLPAGERRKRPDDA